MALNYENSDLRNKTILDFTNDKDILDDLIGDKDYFLSHLDETRRAMSLIDYAEYIEDKELISAVEKEFEKEFAMFFNE